MKHRSGKLAGILILVLLAATLAAGYFLYFHHGGGAPPEQEIVAEIVSTEPQAPIQQSVTQKLSPEELQAVRLRRTVEEFRSLTEAPAEDWAVPSGPIEAPEQAGEIQTAELESPPEPEAVQPPATDEAKPDAEALADTNPGLTAPPRAPEEMPENPVTESNAASPPAEETNTPDAPEPPEAGVTIQDSEALVEDSPPPPEDERPKETARTEEAASPKEADQPAEVNQPAEADKTLEAEQPPTDEPVPQPGGKCWVINAMSTQEPAKAEQTIKALRQSPYTVYQYEAEVKGQKWLRVRVGFFGSKSEAESIGRKLAQEHNLPDPWIVTPGPNEVSRFRNPASGE